MTTPPGFFTTKTSSRYHSTEECRRWLGGRATAVKHGWKLGEIVAYRPGQPGRQLKACDCVAR